MSDVKALFGLIDKKNKRRLIGAVICCVLSVLCGILPYSVSYTHLTLPTKRIV